MIRVCARCSNNYLKPIVYLGPDDLERFGGGQRAAAAAAAAAVGADAAMDEALLFGGAQREATAAAATAAAAAAANAAKHAANVVQKIDDEVKYAQRKFTALAHALSEL